MPIFDEGYDESAFTFIGDFKLLRQVEVEINMSQTSQFTNVFSSFWILLTFYVHVKAQIFCTCPVNSIPLCPIQAELLTWCKAPMYKQWAVPVWHEVCLKVSGDQTIIPQCPLLSCQLSACIAKCQSIPVWAMHSGKEMEASEIVKPLSIKW